jgi:hypothetical protein
MAVYEHPSNPDLLFAGVHNGLMVSVNGGENWKRAGGNLPPVSVNDIAVKNGDLVLATYGRGIIILDDADYLAEATPEVLEEDAHLFSVRDAELFFRNGRDLSNKAARWAGPNPDYGASITYYLKDDPVPVDPEALAEGEPSPEEVAGEEPSSEPDQASTGPQVSIEILDSAGEVVRELKAPDQKGFNRITWDLRTPADSTEAAGQEERGRRPEWVDVEPGEYTIKLTTRDLEMVRTVTVVSDKRRREK